jgi:hypothetical protein
MNSQDCQNIRLLYEAVYDSEMREYAHLYNNTIFPEDIPEQALEYFYEMGLSDEHIDIIIENLNVEEFDDLVNNIFSINKLNEARLQDVIAGQILKGIERHSRATEKFGKSKAGRALGAIGDTLTKIGDAGAGAADKAAASIDRAIDRKKHEARGRYRLSNLGQERASSGGVVTKSSRSDSSVSPSSSGRALPPSKYGSEDASGQRSLFDTPKGRLSKPLGKVTAPKRSKPKRVTGKYRQTTMRFPKNKTKTEQVELWVNDLIYEGYDLSDFTWEEMYDLYDQYFES